MCGHMKLPLRKFHFWGVHVERNELVEQSGVAESV